MMNRKINEAINDQIKNEIESSYIYLSMVAYFHSLSLDGMAHWMRCQAHEEMIHAMKLFDHINDRGGKITLLDVKQLRTEWPSPLEAFRSAYAHEQFISGKINDLVALSREEKEYASEPLLAWFVDEQVEEEANASKIVADLELAGDDKSALLMLDRELGTRAFPPGSPFDPAALKSED